jgi:hypothetical protein
MSEVIRSSMTSIPDENWELAFGKKELPKEEEPKESIEETN